jgi:hypothetical protein
MYTEIARSAFSAARVHTEKETGGVGRDREARAEHSQREREREIERAITSVCKICAWSRDLQITPWSFGRCPSLQHRVLMEPD